ncbi:MAG: hypothetical protein WC806_02975, partial [Candidatus Gracilibacteria bacterium]
SARDFLYPDADERYVPNVGAYIHEADLPKIDELLVTVTPDVALTSLCYLSGQERIFAARAMLELWRRRLTEDKWGEFRPHIKAWMAERDGHANRGQQIFRMAVITFRPAGRHQLLLHPLPSLQRVRLAIRKPVGCLKRLVSVSTRNFE